MNRRTHEERNPAPPIKPRYGQLALHTLLCLTVYHAVTCLIYRLVFYKLEMQMIVDGNTTGLAWILFAYTFVTLSILAIITVVLYYRNETRMNAYTYETSLDRFGRRGARAARKRHRGFACKEALLFAGLSALIWLPATLSMWLVKIVPGSAVISFAASKMDTLFIGIVGLFHPFGKSALLWIGYAIGAVWLFALRFLGSLLVHRKWDDEYAD